MYATGIETKGWGREETWANNELYCGRLLHVNEGAKISMHFHVTRDKTWYVLSGRFTLRIVNTQDAVTEETELTHGFIWHQPAMVPHQLCCIEAGTIIEISTPDTGEDIYRINPGDSQL